jgi:DNA-binding transcriptional regulator YdaS (Cro superfamily)
LTFKNEIAKLSNQVSILESNMTGMTLLTDEKLQVMSKEELIKHVHMQDLSRLAAMDGKLEKDKSELRKKNDDFYMVFKRSGSPLLRNLIEKSSIAARLFLFLTEEADRSNALVASQKALAIKLEVSEASITRAIKMLEELEMIERQFSGGTSIFVLNPAVVWNAWAIGKNSCMFGNARVLISKDEQPEVIKKRVNLILTKAPAKPSEENEEVIA